MTDTLSGNSMPFPEINANKPEWLEAINNDYPFRTLWQDFGECFSLGYRRLEPTAEIHFPQIALILFAVPKAFGIAD